MDRTSKTYPTGKGATPKTSTAWRRTLHLLLGPNFTETIFLFSGDSSDTDTVRLVAHLSQDASRDPFRITFGADSYLLKQHSPAGEGQPAKPGCVHITFASSGRFSMEIPPPKQKFDPMTVQITNPAVNGSLSQAQLQGTSGSPVAATITPASGDIASLSVAAYVCDSSENRTQGQNTLVSHNGQWQYTFSWPSTSFPSGNYLVYVVATGAESGMISQCVPVTV